MPDQRFEIVIIGGGIVGTSVACQIVRRFPALSVALLEKEDRVARHQSGHNSGVIHSGLYYRPGSLKARLCVEGARAMVEFCREHGIVHQVCGKVVVATSAEQVPQLEALYRRGLENGLAGLTMLDPVQLKEIEPHAAGVRALLVPSTGITDYAMVTEKYAELFKSSGGTLVTSCPVLGVQVRDRQIIFDTPRGEITAKYAINCAGLFSDRISRMAGHAPGIMVVPFRGEYYDLTAERSSLVRGLIYPVPDSRFPFLGVHFTRRVHGGVDAGPNAVLALKREGYHRTDFNLADSIEWLAYPGFWKMGARHWRHGFHEVYRSFRKAAFVAALRKLVPEIRGADLVPGGSGVRAQALARDGSLVDDFQFSGSGNMLHVLNVPSPAATASIPVGRTIVEMAERQFELASVPAPALPHDE